MNFADPFKQLVERKLWPIALLLVAALVAVPVLLAEEPEAPVLPSAVASQSGGADAPTESVVSLDDATRVDDARAVLGVRKDPFRPAQLHPVPTVEDSLGESATSTQSASTSTSTSSSSSSSSSAGSTSSSSSSAPAASSPAQASKPAAPVVDTVAIEVPRVSFDLKRSGKEVVFDVAKRLQPYPSASNPVALYLGLDEKGKAVFSLDEGVEVEGDFKCVPSNANCDAVLLGNEDTVFLTRGDKEYALEVLIEETDVAVSDAAAYWATEAKGGAEALKDMGAAGYRYDKTTGRVEPIKRTKPKADAKRSGSRLLSVG